jgi:hypothetical protein
MDQDQDHRSAAPGACPACGTPYYPAGAVGAGCPVCLLRAALGPEATSEGDPPSEGSLQPVGEGRFDHYELVRREDGAFEELGRGAMGITYRAFDTVLGHAVAVKILDTQVAANPQARERFLREARAAAQLRHSNVASVFYYGVRPSDGQCFYAMELVEGESVEARVRREGPLPAGMTLEVATQVARALAAAETQGLVHRDLKPANLMLAQGPELTVKVIDFGLAKAVADPAGEAALTQGGFVGTPTFASPEQCTSGGVDARSDLYSLGITLWEMLTGQAPFLGSPAEVMRQHRQAPLPLERLRGIPQPAVALLQALLEKDPARRLQSATQLLQVIPAIIAAIDARRTLRRAQLHKGPAATSSGPARKSPGRQGPRKVSLARLPVTGSQVFGRAEDLAFLDAAWADPQVNLVSVVAWGGVGKSTLVNRWLRSLAADRYRSAELVFGWSFYRQGTREDTASADEFIDAALAWFEDPDPRLGTGWEKGERLARLISQHRTLLVLDGLEPLQNPPGPQEGRLREPALQALLRELAAFNHGLCVVTTRLAVADLAEYEGASALRLDLEQLSPEAGAQLLRGLGVKGPGGELQRASEEFRGHCLALTLLGSYLTEAYGGDIRCRQEVSSRLVQDVRQGAHAQEVMASYQRWWGEGPEVSVLRLLGLFDRPADEWALAALLRPPAIPGLTESLAGLRPAEWRAVLTRLRRARLLAGEDPHHPGQLDAHPLVREYFGGQLRNQQRPAWQEANRRLYEHYRTLAPELPESFRDMEPLFLAVICGCHAGLFRQALHEVYIPRIQRGNVSFTANVLGSRGALLSVLIHFFEHGHWGSPAKSDVDGQNLTAEDQLFILMQAALYLTATRGMAAPEASICYERAEPLCHLLNRSLPLYVALVGQWRYALHTDTMPATMQIAQRVYALAQEQNDPVLLVGAHRALAATMYFMGDFRPARRYARLGVRLWRSRGVVSPVEEALAPAVACLCYEALTDWHLGEIPPCHATTAKALSLAKELNDTHGLAVAFWLAGLLGQFEREPVEVERWASALIELSTRQSFAFWLAAGKVLRGWARSASGQTAEALAWIEAGIEDWQATGSVLIVPYWLSIKAEVLHSADRVSEALEAISKADTLAEASAECWWRAELHRLRGVFLMAMGADEAQIHAAFHQAVSTARQQKSISLAARAEASYAMYCGPRGS